MTPTGSLEKKMPLEIYQDQSYFYIYMRFTWGIVSACGFVMPCYHVGKKSDWLMNMHYGPKEAPLALFWSPAEVHRSWMWQRCHLGLSCYVTLLCDPPFSSWGGWGLFPPPGPAGLMWPTAPCSGGTAGLRGCAEVCLHVSQGPAPCLAAGPSHPHGALHLPTVWAHLSSFLVSTTAKELVPVSLLEYHKMGEILAVNRPADSFLSFLIFYLWGRGHRNNWRCLFAPTAICEWFAM